MASLSIECSDGEVVSVERDILLRASHVVKSKYDSAPSDSPIVMDNVTATAMEKVMEYCLTHANRVTPAGKRVQDFKSWDASFVQLDPGALCELASAAYHLEIKPLVDLTCQSIAQLLKGKSPAEIRRTFNILYDFTPEDDAPPPTMRDKLRTKLVTGGNKQGGNNPGSAAGSRDGKTQQRLSPTKKSARDRSKSPAGRNRGAGNPQNQVTDTRSVDELLEFINTPTSSAGNDTPKKKKKKKKKKRKNKQTNATVANGDQQQHKQQQQAKQEQTKQETPPIQEDSQSTMSTRGDDANVSGEDEDDAMMMDHPEIDAEVREFQKRLEEMNSFIPKQKIALPAEVTIALKESI